MGITIQTVWLKKKDVFNWRIRNFIKSLTEYIRFDMSSLVRVIVCFCFIYLFLGGGGGGGEGLVNIIYLKEL